MGRLADAELRVRKSKAHAAFDPLWKEFKIDRGECYKWLARKMDLSPLETHIGMFDMEQCAKVIQVSNELKEKLHDVRVNRLRERQGDGQRGIR